MSIDLDYSKPNSVTRSTRDDAVDATETRLAAQILQAVQTDLSRDGFLHATLPAVLQFFGGDSGGLVSQQAGRWRRESWIGQTGGVPEPLVVEALDKGSVQFNDEWCVVPFGLVSSQTSSTNLVGGTASALVLKLGRQDHAADMQAHHRQVTRVSGALVNALQRLDVESRQARRIDQLSVVLKAAAQWQQIEDGTELLSAIADTATKLLNCERASIFLWDKRRKKLIGRPALGIQGGVLEVDDNVGVVGEVLSTKEHKIWNSGSDSENRVNRTVDQSHGFETRSLVAVPMQGRRENLIGVFEAINHRAGGFDTFDAAVLTDLATHAAVAIEGQRTRQSLTASRDRLLNDAATATPLVGTHASVERIRQDATKVAGTDLTVLVLGENGTGKEVLARHVHYQSKRRSGPFIAVNCAALVESLLESELFGHEKGAFTDAQQSRPGKFELANGGTLFLDEVGDMSPGGQAKLLRVLEEKVVVRVGGSQTIPVDVRVIAATNQPLEKMIVEKNFREDLYFRLNVVSLTLPPLRDRGADVIELAGHFFNQYCHEIGRAIPTLSPDAQSALLSHPWAGNIRELRNTIERVCYLTTENEVNASDLMLTASPSSRLQSFSSAGAGTPLLTDATRDFQVQHIEQAIATSKGNMTDAAARLGLHRSNLYRKMRQLGMQTSGE